MGGGGGGNLHQQILSFTIHDFVYSLSQLLQTSRESEEAVLPGQVGDWCMVKISLLSITTLTHVMIQVKATNQWGEVSLNG